MGRLAQVPEPPESSSIRAKNLRNQPCLVRAGAYEEVDGRDGKPWKYVVCEVHVLDRDGIKESGDGVRISWARAVPQLRAAEGEWLPVRPIEDGNSVVLEPLTGADLAVAERVVEEL